MFHSRFVIPLFLSMGVALCYAQEEDPMQNALIPNENQNFSKNAPYVHIQNQYDTQPDVQMSENESTMIMPTEHGKVKVTCGVKNTDFVSQCRAEREKAKKKKNPKEESKEDSCSPKAEISITWSSDE